MIRTERIVVALFALALVAGGCGPLKRCAYSGGDRDQWQKPDQVMAELALEPGDRVADLGAGGGYFTFRLADAVGDAGHAYAVDVDREMLDYLATKAKQEGRTNVTVVEAEFQDPKIPEPVDLILTVNTYHHLENQTAYFSNARRYLRDHGRVAVIELKKGGFFSHFFSHYTDASTIRSQMEAAGYQLAKQLDFLERQSFLIFERAN
jgi:ubiquinone/menaquinone biosynthesis C-methylase UbiE